MDSERLRAALKEACEAFVEVESLYIEKCVSLAKQHPDEVTTMSTRVVLLQDRVAALRKPG